MTFSGYYQIKYVFFFACKFYFWLLSYWKLSFLVGKYTNRFQYFQAKFKKNKFLLVSNIFVQSFDFTFQGFFIVASHFLSILKSAFCSYKKNYAPEMDLACANRVRVHKSLCITILRYAIFGGRFVRIFQKSHTQNSVRNSSRAPKSSQTRCDLRRLFLMPCLMLSSLHF